MRRSKVLEKELELITNNFLESTLYLNLSKQPALLLEFGEKPLQKVELYIFELLIGTIKTPSISCPSLQFTILPTQNGILTLTLLGLDLLDL